MAELTPYPFGRLVRRMFVEMEKKQAIFDLPSKKFFPGYAGVNLSVKVHGTTASSPLGPAAGPQSQLAQNIVLAWLGGSRIIELKTVQVMDDLNIPRPCIEMRNVGYNVEWSQELRITQSLEEYVKASMLIEILAHSGLIPLVTGFNDVIFDMSVGYDLKGIKSEKVQGFIHGLQNAAPIVEKLRREIPPEFKRFRDLPFKTKLSNTLTLSTFHGCPPHEIEAIIDFLLNTNGLNCVIKFNPTLLGANELRRILNEKLGYADLQVPDESFEKDTRWEQAVQMVSRLRETAKALGLGLGAKFSNTLIVKNHRGFFGKENKEMYASGAPLHVLAMNLVAKFRKVFGGEIPISFSAGIDRFNVADAVSLGLVPVTFCTDLLKTGGYARQESYFKEILKRMDAVDAYSIGDFILKAHGQSENAAKTAFASLDEASRVSLGKAVAESQDGPSRAALMDWAAKSGVAVAAAEKLYERWVGEAVLFNTEKVVPSLEDDPRYSKAENSRDPQKVGSKLALFNCITCDKCVPVCPNNANFTFVLPQIEIPVLKWRWKAGHWEKEEAAKLVFSKKHQIGNFADFCNECGNCDIFCPEEGGPYVMKPRFFGRLEDWNRYSDRDGFFFERASGFEKMHGRFSGREYVLTINRDGQAMLENGGVSLQFHVDQVDAAPSVIGPQPADGTEIDFTYFHIMNWLRQGISSEKEVNYVTI